MKNLFKGLFLTGANNRFKNMLTMRKPVLGMILFTFVSAMYAASFAGTSTSTKIKGAAVYSIILAFPAGTKGTKALHGDDETDEQFAARKGKAETEESLVLRKMAHMVNEAEKRFDEENKPAIKAMQESIEKLQKAYDTEGVEALKKAMREQGLVLESLKDNIKVNSNRHKSAKEQFGDFLNEKKNEILNMKRAGNGQLEFKVAGVITTGSAAVPEGIPDIQGVQVAPPTNVNLRGSYIDQFVSHFSTGLSSYAYTESLPKDGDAAFLAETAAKTQIDWKIETRYAPPKKVAAYQILTEESVQDIIGLQSIAYDYLKKKHDLKRQNKILFGAGTVLNVGDEPCGAFTPTTGYASAFTAGSMANAVVTPNFMDVINAAITQIYTTHNFTDEMPYEANLVLVSPVDFFLNLVSAKTSFGTPLYPTASLFNEVKIGGATIKPSIDIPAGYIGVADMSRYMVSDYVPYTVRIGWINENFIHNEFVILGESRLHAFVKKLDRVAFVYDTIANIKTAITLVPAP